MATLNKLALRGVRSFDDKDLAIIEFFTPLTVIVGYNGSGKTTIIEALKYATTGDMPPNTKGGAFIHDPKMASANEVKAQVRLRFYSADKTRFNCVRNVQVSVKKGGGLTLKTLEGLLQIDDPAKARNKRATISTKCADLDEEIPRLLGVSRSILENVIFCHQEESNWPLSEASVLKKKFDDIFDATRYSKALDNIKVMRKDRANELKVARAELDAAKTDRDRSEALKAKVATLRATLLEKQARLDGLDEKIRRITKENKHFYDSAVKFREIVNLAETLEEKKRLHHQNREAVRSTMTSIEESDEELERRRDSFQDHLDKLRRRRVDLAQRIDEKRTEIRALESRHSKQLSERGALEADKRSHEQNLGKRERLIRSTALEMGFQGFDVSGMSESMISDFMARLNESVRRAGENLQSFKTGGEARESQLSNAYQELRNQRSGLSSSRDTTASAAKKIKERVKQAQDELDCLPIVGPELETARKLHAEDVAKVERLRRELDEANFDEKMRKKNNEIREADDCREELTAQLNTLNRRADSRAKVDVKSNEIEQKTSSAQALFERHEVQIKKYITGELRVDTLDNKISHVFSLKSQELLQAEREENGKVRDVQHLESALSISRSELSEKQTKLFGWESQIKEFLSREGDASSTVAQTLETAEREIEQLSESESSGAHALDLFNRILATGRRDHHCIGCGRGIKQEEVASFEKYVGDKVKALSPEGRKELQDSIQDWRDLQTQARSLLTIETSVKEMRDSELPALENKIKRQVDELAHKSQLAEKASFNVNALKEQQQEMTLLRRMGQEVSRLLAEATTLRADVVALKEDLASTGSTQTGDQVQTAITDMADSIKKMKRELQSVERSRDAKRNELNNAERACFRSEKIVADKIQEDLSRTALQKRIEERISEQEEVSQELKRLDVSIDNLVTPIKKARDELESARSETSQEDKRLSGILSELQAKQKALREINEVVEDYADANVWQKLKDCVGRIDHVKSELDGVHGQIREVESEMAKIDKDLNESKATERNILDNLRYRQLESDLQQIDNELDKLDLDEASKARKEFESKYHDQKQTENALNGEAQHISGQVSSLEEQIRSREDELNNEYNDVFGKFSKKLVEVKTSEIINADLERYAKALEQAIIRFHGLKMEEVNEQIRYLWAKTYQGSDIDSISIESDTEKIGNRSYNYRVCMMKDNVKMDMRGRCSAGQKVLASIIIRLALADSFATNCRFMALDEPTLCLDHETVGALARSLADIIKERPNTQLIVVTHDQEFLSLLATHASVDDYWRVSRDEFQKSYIERSRVR